MQKIMFNDKFGLTQAVLEGRKTMTRRIITFKQEKWLRFIEGDNPIDWIRRIKYIPKEVVAVAQSYNDVYEELKRTHGSSSSVTRNFFHKYIQGGRMPVSNKMFVKAEAMLNRIRITDIKVERLQDISDEDCSKEGIGYVGGYSENYYLGHGVQTPNGWAKFGNSPREAYAALIDKVSGNGTWERNPYVFVYEFELVK